MSATSRRPSRLPRRVREGDLGTDDELANLPATARPSSHGKARIPAIADSSEAPNVNLQQLAGLMHKPSTPLRRASSAGPSSIYKTVGLTSANPSQTPSLRRPSRPTPAKRGAPTTPHAIRALQQRRAAAIRPGRDRRRSGRLQRETPRDMLRNLSRVLAHTTQIVDPSTYPPQEVIATKPSISRLSYEHETFPELPKPRLSMPIHDADDVSFHVSPPRLSISLEEDSQTQRSVEASRRALSERPSGRFSRGSFGSVRISDRFGDINDVEPDLEIANDLVDQSARIVLAEEYDDLNDLAEDPEPGGDTQELRRGTLGSSGQRQSHISDILGRPLLQSEDDTTFAFNIPSIAERNMSRRTIDHDMDSEIVEKESDHMNQEGRTESPIRTHKLRTRQSKVHKKSRYGISYPSLPVGVMKKLVSSFARSSGNSKAKINKQSLNAVMQASDWFFEQVGDDLGTYAKHAGRKTIDETDVITLLKRQRQLTATTTPFSLAQKYLSRELLQKVRMAPPAMHRHRSMRDLESFQAQDDDEVK